jgi:undecaprenyl-diphosphatase
MTWWEAIVLGLVEGITEYLPVSSTGHLILAAAFLGLDRPEIKPSVDAFLIVVQGGAILAVLGLYWPRVLQILRGLIGQDPAGRRLLVNLLVAFVPAAALGPVADDWIDEHLFHVWPVLAALLLGGLWMLWLGRKGGAASPEAAAGAGGSMGIDDLTWQKALGIGLFQCVSMWPGTSRSMMTIAGGTVLGLRPKEAAEFSFLLALPTLGGATVFKLYKNLHAAGQSGGPNLFEQLGVGATVIGIAAAALSAALAVRWLVGFLNQHGLALFGWYRIGLAVVLGGLLLGGVVGGVG